MKLGAIVVLYNTKIDESTSINTSVDYLDQLVIFDNSTDTNIQQYNNNYVKADNIIYLSKNKNCGLSKAYNVAKPYLKDNDFVILMDDDTSFNQDYFLAIRKIQDENIYAPLIYVNKNLVNPNYRTNNLISSILKQKKYNNQQSIKTLENTNRLGAINSGIILPQSFLQNYQFDESLFLDCIDWRLSDDIYKLGFQLKILPVEINQNFSINNLSKINNSSLIHRLEIRLNDLKNYDKKVYFINKLIVILRYVIDTKKFWLIKYIFY